MKRQPKYKSFSKDFLLQKFPIKIFNFKKSKWLRVKKFWGKKLKGINEYKKYAIQYRKCKKEVRRVTTGPHRNWRYIRFPHKFSYYKKKKLKKNLISANPFKSYVFKKKKITLSTSYNEKVKFRQSLLKIWNKKEHFHLKNKNKLHLLSSIWYKPFYKPYQLLWYTKFVSSSDESRKKMESKDLLLNDVPLKRNTLLTKGDILTYKNPSYKFSTVNKKFYSRYLNIKTILVDYYSQEIVVTQDFKKLNGGTLFDATPRIASTKYLDL